MTYGQMAQATEANAEREFSVWRAPSAAQHLAALAKRMAKTEAAKVRMAKQVAKATPKECLCGCGSFPSSPRSRFLPGHDGRLKGLLLVAARNGDAEAKEKLTSLGWGHFLAS